MPAVSNGQHSNGAGGCVGCLAAVIVLAVALAALISVAATIDPFSWMPPVGDIWADCDDDFTTDRDECALENRFPGFWLHAVVNLAYVVTASGLVLALLGSVADLRGKRVARFSAAAAAEEHRSAARLTVGCGAALALTSLLPVVVAIA